MGNIIGTNWIIENLINRIKLCMRLLYAHKHKHNFKPETFFPCHTHTNEKPMFDNSKNTFMTLCFSFIYIWKRIKNMCASVCYFVYFFVFLQPNKIGVSFKIIFFFGGRRLFDVNLFGAQNMKIWFLFLYHI